MSAVDERAWIVPQQPQCQASLTDQLQIVHAAAARLGCYDAADLIWKRLLSTHTEIRA